MIEKIRCQHKKRKAERKTKRKKICFLHESFDLICSSIKIRFDHLTVKGNDQPKNFDRFSFLSDFKLNSSQDAMILLLSCHICERILPFNFSFLYSIVVDRHKRRGEEKKKKIAFHSKSKTINSIWSSHCTRRQFKREQLSYCRNLKIGISLFISFLHDFNLTFGLRNRIWFLSLSASPTCTR